MGRLFRRIAVVLVLLPGLVNLGWVAGTAEALTGSAVAAAEPAHASPLIEAPMAPAAPATFCSDTGVTGNGGNPLDECQGLSFTMGGNTWDVSVYYTLDTGAGDDWIITHTQATPIVGWMRDAYLAYFEQTGRTYGGGTSCDRHIRAKVMKGDGWSGIAWWPNSCSIGLDAPMIRGGGGRGTTMHEMRHKVVQFAYPNCLDDWDGDYPGTTIHIVEGDADYGPSTVGDFGYVNSFYDPGKRLQDHGYNNMFIPYYSEHVDLYAGPFGSPGDPDYLAGGMVKHWEICEAQGDLYVMRDVVQGYTPLSFEHFFLNFFAALYLHSFADPVTQPELYFFEEDAPLVNITYAPPLEDSVNLAAGGSQSWSGESTPDRWAGTYYEIRPQVGCPYVMLEGSGSGTMGWAMMAANAVPANAEYSGWVGSSFSRIFAAHGAHDRIAVAAVAFGTNRTYDLTARCVAPQIEIQRPIAPNYRAFVGDPLSPVAFMAMMRVTDGAGTPVSGIPTDWFVLDAEGDAVTPTTLVEVTKGYYLGVYTPPTKPAGTTTVDLRACLGTSGICDTNADALIYVPPGNIDMVLLHDASGSMGWIDVPGDLPRLEQAKRAAELLVMLAQAGDAYGIMDFSAKDDPPGCAPNCPHDVQVVYPKTAIADPAAQIPGLVAAINGMTDREWTNLGEGLRRAQLMVLGTPYSANNKVVTLLSDGEENVKPYYDEIAADLSVVVNTMGFSGDAPNDLLARIAAENLGQFLYVPTSPGSALASASGGTGLTAVEIERTLLEGGVAPAAATELAAVLAPSAVYVPAGLGLRDAYDYRQGEAAGASRIAANTYVEVAEATWQVQSANVSKADNRLALVSSSREPDSNGCGWVRDVEVRIPGTGEREWIPISPPTEKIPIPPNWDVRNGAYHDVLYVSAPEPGTWQIRTRVHYVLCSLGVEPQAPAATVSFLQTAKVQSTIKIEGEILLENRQGRVGDPVPLLGTVLTRAGATPGAVVAALIERPGGTSQAILLRDDGASGDGAAGDGVAGNIYTQAVIGGAYNVTIAALGYDPHADPAAPQLLLRVWKGSFYMEGPGPDDNQDDDDLPPWWEEQYRCMDPKAYNSPKDDYDQDGLSNYEEWLYGTDPCNPDTDAGGESDGSEVAGGRNPNWAQDDVVPPIHNWSVRPLNLAALIRWSRPLSYTTMLVRVTDPTGRTETLQGGRMGTLTVTLANDTTYTVTLQGATEEGTGGPTAPEQVTPKADPDAPSGAVLINYGVPSTTQRAVTLYVSATDVPLDGIAAQPSGAVASVWTAGNEVSGGVEMRFRNGGDVVWTAWRSFAEEVPWTLPAGCRLGAMCRVEAQFRDAVQNESMIVFDEILLEPAGTIYLPLVLRQAP